MDILQKRPTQAILFRKRKQLYTQGVFLKRLGLLLREGFSLKDALSFMHATSSKEKKEWIQSIQEGLKKGNLLQEELFVLHFPERVCSQLYFSLVHGHFAQTVERCGQQILSQVEKRKKLMQIIHYPCILLFFMTGMLLAMRFIFLPHIQQMMGADAAHSMNALTKAVLMLVYTSPYWLVSLMVCGVLCFFVLKRYLNKKTAIDRLTFYCRLPIVRPFLTLYWTHFCLFEWGQLLENGCSLKEVVTIMQTNEVAPFLQEASEWIGSEMGKGKHFREALAAFKFLKEEVGEIISHGEASGALGKEFILFAEECEEELTQRVERLMEKIQPFIFIVVALMIIAIYAAMLLPTLSLMEGF